MIDRSEELVTVFGGSGFIGRYVCELLMKSGVRVRVATRDPRNSYFIQPLGQVGQFGFIKADITDADGVKRAVDGASAVVNLCGVFGRAMQGVHVEGARNLAEAAKKAGAEALVHVSAIGADPNSASNYGRTKGEGELAVRKAFPKATIVRPSLVFGPEDNLTNRFAGLARLPILPVIAANRNFQPVYVRDLAKAIAKAALDPQAHGWSPPQREKRIPFKGLDLSGGGSLSLTPVKRRAFISCVEVHPDRAIDPGAISASFARILIRRGQG